MSHKKISYLINAKEAKEVVERIIFNCSAEGQMNIIRFGSEIASWCHGYTNEKLGNNQNEVVVPLMSVVLAAWSSWILESKAICHYRKPQPSYRNFLENTYLPNIKDVLIKARNLAIDEKREKQMKGDAEKDYDVPADIKIPHYYTQDC